MKNYTTTLNEKEKAIAVAQAFSIWFEERSPEEVVQVLYPEMERSYLRHRADDLEAHGPAVFFNRLNINKKARCVCIIWDNFGAESMRRVAVARERARKCKHTK
jgi:hypothetical protein|tara:strand:+ start:537 stop:848 length:312 start_codon:yes stop_codon:yes gene_type:complete